MHRKHYVTPNNLSLDLADWWNRNDNKKVSIGSDNCLSPGRRQAITYTNAEISLIGPLGTNFSEIGIKIQNFSSMKMHLKMLSGKWQPFCPGVDELTHM